MSEERSSCNYSIRISERDGYKRNDFPAEVLDNGVWHCPHEAENGEQCPFHTPVEETEEGAAVEAFRNAISREDGESATRRSRRQRREFIDATFGPAEWSTSTLVGENGPDELYLTHAEFEAADFSEVQFDADVRFTASTFDGPATFSGATFEGDTRFNECTFNDTAAFDRTTFHEEVRAGGTVFAAEADFYRAIFEADLNMKRVDFFGKATFWKATLVDTVRFNDATFHPLDDDAHELHELDLSNGNFTNAILRDVNLEASELTKAKLFGADLRGCLLHGAVLTDSRIDDQTRFLGSPESVAFSVTGLVRFWNKPRCVYDPAYAESSVGEDTDVQRNRAKSTYRAIEEIAGSASRPALQSMCFINRQDVHRRTHRDELRTGIRRTDSTAEAGASAPERRSIRDGMYRTLKLFQWGRAELSRWTLLYGESPWRIIATGLVIVLVFALLYPLGGLEPADGTSVTYETIVEQPSLLFDSIYFSTLTFTTLGMGDYQPIGIAQVLTTLQTAVGAVLIALLVFVFGRRTAR